MHREETPGAFQALPLEGAPRTLFGARIIPWREGGAPPNFPRTLQGYASIPERDASVPEGEGTVPLLISVDPLEGACRPSRGRSLPSRGWRAPQRGRAQKRRGNPASPAP